MKQFAAPVLFIAILLTAATVFSRPQDEPAALEPEQQWLKQLVGEWDVQFKMYMQEDQPPAEAAGTDTVRPIGDHWIIAETNSVFIGSPFTGVLSLGYDTQKKHYVGTWIDSMSGYLWTYKGTLNEARDTLTLETEGPSFEGPDKTARYKEVIEIKGEDHRAFTSSIETDDGTWIRILSADYHRKK